MSKGAEELLSIVQELYPNQKIILEHNVADRGSLFIDIYLPRLMIAFEFDGEQHFAYSEHFHGSKEGFAASKKRDLEKNEICEEKGITMIRVRYDETLTKELVLSKIEEAFNV